MAKLQYANEILVILWVLHLHIFLGQSKLPLQRDLYNLIQYFPATWVRSSQIKNVPVFWNILQNMKRTQQFRKEKRNSLKNYDDQTEIRIEKIVKKKENFKQGLHSCSLHLRSQCPISSTRICWRYQRLKFAGGVND